MNDLSAYFDSKRKALVSNVFKDYFTVSIIGLLRKDTISNNHDFLEPFRNEKSFSEELDFLISTYSKYKILRNLFTNLNKPTDCERRILSFSRLYEILQKNTGNKIYRDELFEIVHSEKTEGNSSTIENISSIYNISSKEAFLLVQRSNRNLLNYFTGLISETFWFEYVGQNITEDNSFCEKYLNQTFHINDIMEMKNNQIEPVYAFCGGLKCHHYWEADPFYNLQNKSFKK